MPEDRLPDEVRDTGRVRRLLLRSSAGVTEAPESDQIVAQGYESTADKGLESRGIRLTILSSRARYRIGEEVRVIHVLESTSQRHTIYPSGPKLVLGEFVDGRLATEASPENDEPWVPLFYDGPTVSGPGIDMNYDITSYSFDERGIHTVYWQLGSIRSNILEITVD